MIKLRQFCDTCEKELKGEIVTFRLCYNIENIFCDEKCLEEWICENTKYKKVDKNGRVI